MIDDQRVVGLIPARGGSTSVPRKNIRPLGGKPLIAWSIEVAQAVEAIDRTVVSTDDEEIAAVSRQYGAEPVDRPSRLSGDEALVVDAIRYHLSEWRAEGEPVDIVVLLEPTCPLRSADDVQVCLRRLTAGGVDSVATFTDASLNPNRTWRIDDRQPEPFVEDGDPWTARQQLPDAYQLNGGVYAFFADRLPEESVTPFFGRREAVYMPEERSVDIDTTLDLRLARLLVDEHSLAT